MNHNMSTQFIHSVKVPRLFKESAKTVKKVLAEGASFKSLVFNHKHPNVQGIYALVSQTLQHSNELQILLDKTNILVENPRFDPWLARVLITELLWGKKVLKSDAKPVETVLSYREKLQQALTQNLDATVDPSDKKTAKLPRYVRINTLLTSIDEALNAFCDEGWNLLPKCDSYTSFLENVSNLGNDDFIQDFHIPEVLAFPPGTKFHDHPGYKNGKLLLQDKASCLSAFLLNPKPNSEILDMCAAPGMKTTHLAAIINNSGKIYAVEMNQNRYKTLCDFVNQTSGTCIETINVDALTISPDKYPNVKYILVDPSCSGSGMVDRIDIQKQDQGTLNHRLRRLQNLQSMILGHALRHFPNVKKVIYSTCSLYPQENECVVDEAMRYVGNKFTLVNLKKKLNNEWHNVGSKDYSEYGEKCLYALPEKDLCSGFFVAMFKRKSNKVEQEAGTDENSKENITNEEENDKCEFSSKRKTNKNVDEEFSTTCEVEIDQAPPKKSKKKRKLEISEATNTDYINEEHYEKKKKKKLKKSLENQDSTEEHQMNVASVEAEENEEESSRKSKKKNKKKKKYELDEKADEER